MGGTERGRDGGGVNMGLWLMCDEAYEKLDEKWTCHYVHPWGCERESRCNCPRCGHAAKRPGRSGAPRPGQLRLPTDPRTSSPFASPAQPQRCSTRTPRRANRPPVRPTGKSTSSFKQARAPLRAPAVEGQHQEQEQEPLGPRTRSGSRASPSPARGPTRPRTRRSRVLGRRRRGRRGTPRGAGQARGRSGARSESCWSGRPSEVECRASGS